MPCVTYLSKQIYHTNALATISATKSRLESGSLLVLSRQLVFNLPKAAEKEVLKVSTLSCRYSSCRDRQLNTEHRSYRMTGTV